jgi:hypothetical protein
MPCSRYHLHAIGADVFPYVTTALFLSVVKPRWWGCFSLLADVSISSTGIFGLDWEGFWNGIAIKGIHVFKTARRPRMAFLVRSYR